MIDPLAPDFCLLSELLDNLPKRPSPTVVWRWTNKGIKGTRLETIKIAGCQHTTRTEFRRFILAIQKPDVQPEQPNIDAEEQESVSRQLKARGYLR